jgi:beta-lactamase class A
MRSLSTTIQGLIENTTGTWGIVLDDLDLHAKWVWNGDEVFYAASVIKVPIMAAVFFAIQNESLNLGDSILLKKEDFVGGSGVLQHLTPGTSLTLYDIITLMIIQSDNTATNILIDLVGVEQIQQTIRKAGMEKSTFYNKLMMHSVLSKGINQVTALDMAKLLKEIDTGRMASAYAGMQMIEIMKKQQIRDCLSGKLPSPYSELMNGEVRWDLANKTGWIPGVRHDVGVFYVGERKLIASVLSKDVDDLQSKQVLADIGLEIYNYLLVTGSET